MIRDGNPAEVNVIDLVPGDVVRLALGAVIPADIRVIACEDLLCEEGILTGESLPVEKSVAPVVAGAALGDLSSCIFMGTIIHAGSCTGMVVATGGRAEFGRIAMGLSTRQPQTEFQLGLSRFSMLLLEVAIVLTALIFVANLLLQRPLLESLLFSLAIAVGITPQLLPAVVSTSLATGSRALARRRVLVKRLVCIEDLGDMDVLVTDKTGTPHRGPHRLHRRPPGRQRFDGAGGFPLGTSGDRGGLLAAAGVDPGPESPGLGPVGVAGCRGRRRGHGHPARRDPLRPPASDDERFSCARRPVRCSCSPRARRKT